MMYRRTVSCRLLALALACLVCLPVVSGCGKEGPPSPKKTQDTFTISNAGVSFMNDCLVARATVNGAVDNVDAVTFEIAPIQAFDECPGCPFVPAEYLEFPRNAMQLDPQSGQFLISFCPSAKAPMYRWRLVGKNTFHGLPHVATTPRVAIANKEKDIL